MAPVRNRRRRFARRNVSTMQAVGYLANLAADAGKSYLLNRAKGKSAQTSAGVTSQYDRKAVYRRKRMPKRRRIKWKKFIKKVAAATNKSGTSTVVMNRQDYVSILDTLGGYRRQLSYCCTLNGLKGSDNTLGGTYDVGTHDIGHIMANDSGLGHPSTKKILVKSSVLDITIVNEPEGTDYNGNLEIDVYELMFYGPPAQNYNLATCFANDDAAQLDASAPVLDISQRGVSPFELGHVLHQARAKIMKKTKFFLGYGQGCTYQIRDPSNRFYNDEMMSNTTSWADKKTRSLLIISKPVNFIQADKRHGLRFGLTRTYHYEVEGRIDEKNAFYNL